MEKELLALLQRLVREAFDEGRNGTQWADSKARQATRRLEHLKKEAK